ncbi:hypothetical protein [Alloacidobacterium dinghuense]
MFHFLKPPEHISCRAVCSSWQVTSWKTITATA